MDLMTKLKQTLQSMKPFEIECKKTSITVGHNNNNFDSLTETIDTILIHWSKEENHINTNVKSSIDNKSMTGVRSLYLTNPYDYINDSKLIRWNEIFLINLIDDQQQQQQQQSNDFDLNSFAEMCSQAVFKSITPLLDHLTGLCYGQHDCIKFKPFRIGLRVEVNKDKVQYLFGMNGNAINDTKLLAALDNEIVPILHSVNESNSSTCILIEFVFYVQERFNFNKKVVAAATAATNDV
jgi:hypothetical protein